MTNWGAAPAQLKRWNDEENRWLRRMMEMALCYGPTGSTKKEPKMSEVKINVCGVEMTPDQAKKVHEELGKLFNPTPSILDTVRPAQKPIDRFPPISTWPSAPPIFGPNFVCAQKSQD